MSDRPPTRKIIGGIKDENGLYVKFQEADVSIDELFKRGLLTINSLMDLIQKEIAMGMPERDTVANLKDCMGMLEALKKREEDLINKMSDEELQEYTKKL